jgi:hydrogenase maturation protease
MPRETSSVALKAKVVVGLGNPDRADDGVGLAVVEGLSPRPDLDVFASVKTGLDLAMALLPYERVLLVDAAPFLPVGEVALLRLSGEENAQGFPHGLSLAQAFSWLKEMGWKVPEVWILAVGVPAELGFGRGLSPKVQEALPKAREVVERWLAS